MDNIKQRLQLIDMISCKEEQRYWYETTFIYMSKNSHYPRTWVEYDEMVEQHKIICVNIEVDDSYKLFLTPEQASQLGDVRDFKILLQSGYYDKLVEWGLRKRLR